MNSQHKIFVVGHYVWNTASRMRGASQAGWDITWSVPFWGEGMTACRRYPQYRLRTGPDVYLYNHALLEGAIQSQPDIVWVEEPIFTFADTLQAIRRHTGATLVCAYSDDPRDPAKKSRHFDKAVPLYDVIFSTKDELLQLFFNQGCRYPSKFWKGYDPERIYPIKLTEEEYSQYASDVAFIGHADFVKGKSTRLLPLLAIAREVQNMKIWGKTWSKVHWPADLSQVIHPYQIDGLDYSRAICASKVVLQIPSRLARDTHSSRSVEIPACQKMMLAERTVDHQVLFEEDKEAVFFSSILELIDKVKYYIKNDQARESIAQAGYERCLRSGYSNYERMKQMLVLVEKIREGRWVG
jgi:spore maturation protein CgeB